MRKQRIFITTNGCPARILDMRRLIKYFELNNFKIVTNPSKADKIIFLTCSFREFKENESFKYINSYNKFKGELIIAGCMPEIIPKKFREKFSGRFITTKNMIEIDNIFPNFKIKLSSVPDQNFLFNSFKSAIIKFLTELRFSKNYKTFFRKFVYYIKQHVSISDFFNLLYRKKPLAMMRISRGCLGNCTYCSIKKAIGKLESKPLIVCLNEYKNLIDKNHRKFVILADDVGAYGLDINSSFSELLEKFSIIDKNFKVEWHIQDINPVWLIKYQQELFNQIKNGKITKIFCPIQSGSKRILNLMKRSYNISVLVKCFSNLRTANPELKINSEFIIGFPSESWNDFVKTLNLIKLIKPGFVFLYPYHDLSQSDSHNFKNKISSKQIRKRLNYAINFLKQEKINWVCEEK
ncbi:hypothetical protein CMO90_03195 [Candidatus Woesearchaeota archaeon]|jgi:MiaB/RimO family radical SAM methylthiotransferase|nr:hypothetical protein [Candidatus Woesearchaeota archaeon]|tara:strand:+ start:260 stop:1483 length:1224 start_codon:yes stop_codon:yes gene_type:complete